MSVDAAGERESGWERGRPRPLSLWGLAATMGDCQHSHPFNCYRKGQAVWWMLARLAGWPGPGLTPHLYFPVSLFNPQTR